MFSIVMTELDRDSNLYERMEKDTRDIIKWERIAEKSNGESR